MSDFELIRLWMEGGKDGKGGGRERRREESIEGEEEREGERERKGGEGND